jgi:hypothetical protein
MLNPQLHAGAELLRKLAELDEVPFIRHRPVLAVQAEELHATAGFLDDFLELTPSRIDRRCSRFDWFPGVHLLLQRTGRRLELAPAWRLSESRTRERCESKCRHTEGSAVHPNLLAVNLFRL